MLERMALKMVIAFVLGRLEKFQTSVDWAKVKADVHQRILAIIPNPVMNEGATLLVDTVLDTLQAVLSHKDVVTHVIDLVTAQKFEDAALYLKDAVVANLKAKPISLAENQVSQILSVA